MSKKGKGETTILDGKYITNATSTAELAKRLKEISSILTDAKQVDSPDEVPWSASLPKTLADKKYLSHKDKGVQINVACSLADIFRICAPDTPFSQLELRAIFRSFVSQLDGLRDIDGPNFPRYFYLLERLAVVKACILMADPSVGVVDQITDLFQTVLSVCPQQGKKAQSYMCDVLVSILEDGEEFPPEVIDVLLDHIKPANKKAKPDAYAIVREVLARTAERIASALSKKVNDTIEKDISKIEESSTAEEDGTVVPKKGTIEAMLADDTTGKSKMSPSQQTVVELSAISTQLLLYIVPPLISRLENENAAIRSYAVRLLGRLFEEPRSGSNAVSDFPTLFESYVGRMNDVDSAIRVRVIKSAKLILGNRPPTAAADHLFRQLSGKVLDPEEKVRRAAIDTVCATAASTEVPLDASIPVELMRAVGDRTRDKKVMVRSEAIQQLAIVYGKRSKNIKEWGNELERLFGWIPSTVLLALVQDEDDSTKLLVERVLDEILLGEDSSIEARSSALLALFARLDRVGRVAFKKLIFLKKQMQEDVNKYLQIRANIKAAVRSKRASARSADSETQETEDSQMDSPQDAEGEGEGSNLASESKKEENAKLLSEAWTTLVAYYGDGAARTRAVEQWSKLHSHKDENVFKCLETLANPMAKSSEITRARDDLISKLGASNPITSFFKSVATRLQMSYCGQEHISAILKISREHANKGEVRASKMKLNEGVEPPVLAALDLLEEIAEKFPEIFENSLVDLSTLLQEEDYPEIGERVARILSHLTLDISKRGKAVSSSVESRLSELCKSGLPDATKAAVRAIARLYPVKKDAIFSEIASDIADDLHYNDSLEGQLSALSEIASLSPSVFKSHQQSVIEFVSADLLKKSRETPSPSWEEPSSECRCKVKGVKVLSKHAQSLASSPAMTLEITSQLSKVSEILVEIVMKEGEMTEDGSTNEFDRARLRLAASEALLHLCTCRGHEVKTTLKNLNVFVKISMDPSREVRTSFLGILYDLLLAASKLPPKYGSILVLFCVDNDKEISTNARTSFKSFIGKYRNLTQRIAGASLSSPQTAHLFPEYILPFLVHVLAHHPRFSNDLPHYYFSQTVLFQYFEEVMRGVDNVTFFHKLLNQLKIMKDANAPPENLDTKIVCDISFLIVHDKARVTEGKLLFPGEVLVPPYLFQTAPAGPPKKPQIYLPDGFSLSDKSRRGIVAGQHPPSPARSLTSSTGEASTPKSKKEAAKKTKSEQQRSREPTPVKPATAAAPTKSPVRKTARRKLAVEQPEGEGSEEEKEKMSESEEEEKQTKKKAPAKRGRPAKSKAAAAKKETKEKEAPAREARPKRGQKRKAEPESEESEKEEEEEEEEREPSPPAKKGRGRPKGATTTTAKRGAKKAEEKQAEEEPEQETPPEPPAKKPKKAAAETREEESKMEEEPSKPEPSKRSTRAKPSATAVVNEEPVKPLPPPAPVLSKPAPPAAPAPAPAPTPSTQTEEVTQVSKKKKKLV